MSVSILLSVKPIIVKLTGESFKVWQIFKVQWFASLLQCVSVQISSTEIYLSLLLITCAEILQSHFEIILFTKGYFKVISRW